MNENELGRLKSLYEYETKYYARGVNTIAGLDEAGRGPLAGPVVSAVVILPRLYDISDFQKFEGLKDSKKLTSKKREYLFNKIVEDPRICVGIGIVSEKIIDRINILRSTQMSMRKAIANLSAKPQLLLVDGMFLPGVNIPQKKIINGDNLSLSIAAASVVAKVTRDSIMGEYHERYPEFAFHRHKGYATKDHLKRLKLHGPCAIHRRSFAPIALKREIGID